MQYLINDDATKWYSKKEICSICKVNEKTFRRFFEIAHSNTTVQPKILSERDFISVGSSHKKLYTETVLQQFQLWLKKNAINAGGQRTEGSIIKQEIHDIVDNSMNKTGENIMQDLINDDATKWYSVKEICELCKISRQTWINFKNDVSCKVSFTVKRNLKQGDKNVDYYPEPILQQFQLWLKKNAMNAGGQRTEGSIIKQDNQQDLFIGCVATKGTPDEIRSLAQHLQNFANQKELLEQTNQHNQKLLIENHNLSEENNYLKKLSDFQSTQIGYYTKKYHSWYDDYENY